MVLFVRYSCGCIGLVKDESGMAVLFKGCDDGGSSPEYGMFERDMTNQTYVPLELHEAEILMNKIGRLIADGHRLRQIKRALGVETVEE